MAERREEKYLLEYPLYSLVKSRVSQVLSPDAHGDNGAYTVSSLYLDDERYTAYYEKADGLRVHEKYRVRSYDCNKSPLSLERKTKRGIITEKFSSRIDPVILSNIISPGGSLAGMSNRCFAMAGAIRSAGLEPKVIVRYRREAFYHAPTGTRVTFDMNIDAIRPQTEFLFDSDAPAVPALSRLYVIMEVKYGEFLPEFIRKVCRSDAPKQSVSKYALCIDALKQ